MRRLGAQLSEPFGGYLGGARLAGGGFRGAYDAIPNIAVAYGMRRLLSTHTGDILRLRRDSDNAESDFGFIANGDLDTAAIAAWLGAASGYVTTWYDQSGNSYNATQTTVSLQPLFVPDAGNGRPGLRWLKTGSLITPAYAHFPAKRGALMLVHQSTRPANPPLVTTLGGTGNVFFWYSTRSGTKYKWYDGAFAYATEFDSSDLVTQLANRISDTTIEFHENGALKDSLTVTDNQPSSNPLRLLNESSGNTLAYGHVFEFAEFSAALSSEDEASLVANQTQYYGIGSAATRNIACDGDSITAGQGAQPFSALLSVYFLPAIVTNYGVSGQTLNAMASDAATQIDPTIDGTTLNILCAFGGTNDIYFGDSGATAYGDYVAYCQARQAAGWRVVAFTILPRSNTGTPAGFEAERQTFNASVRANWADFADALADVSADSRIGDAGDELDTTYYQADKVHPTTTGQQVIGEIAYNAIATIAN